MLLSSRSNIASTVHAVHVMNADSASGGRQLSDQANRLGCETAIQQLQSTSTIAIFIITQLES